MKEGQDATIGGIPAILFEDFLEELDQGSDEGQQVLTTLRDSFLDSKFESSWKSIRVELVKNKHLDAEFDEKKQDFLIRGRKTSELEEKFGFVAETNVAAVETIAAVGLQSHQSDYNPLGYARLGTYVCKHADVCLQHALLKNPSSQVLRVIVAKYITGRNTTAIPRSATASEFIEPTQGYDSHTSALPPFLQDPLQTQYDRSQVYLYEINKLLQPSLRPRQALPYAVVTFTENGVYLPEVDAKPTAKEKLAGNPRLQEIIKAINSKQNTSKSSSEGSVTAQEKTGVGILQGPSTIEGQAAALKPLASSVAAATGMPVTVGNGLKPMNGIIGSNNMMGGNGMINGNGIKVPSDADRSSQLHMIINHINSKLDTDHLTGAVQARSSTAGDGLLGNAPIVVTAGNSNYSSSNVTFTNGSLGSGSPLGSRPGSAESLLSAQGMTQPAAAQKASIFTAAPGLPSQRFSLLHADHMKGQQVLGPVLPTMPHQLGLGLPGHGFGAAHHHHAAAQQMAAGFISRKELFDLNSIPGLSGAFPLSVYPNHHTLPAQHIMHSLAGPEQLRTSLPLHASYAPFTPSFSTASLSQIPQNPLLLRPGTATLKRAYPDPSSIAWDKRPKLF